MSVIEMLRSELKLARDSGKEVAVMLDMCQKKNEELIRILSQLRNERMQLKEENKRLEEEYKRLDKQFQDYNKDDEKNILLIDDDENVKASDHDSNIRQKATSMFTLKKRPANRLEESKTFGGKSKKKSTKKKRSKQQKTKRRRKNKKN